MVIKILRKGASRSKLRRRMTITKMLPKNIPMTLKRGNVLAKNPY